MIMHSILDKLKVLDAYPKPLEDFRIKTFGGGMVAVLSTVIILLLVLSEVSVFLSRQMDEELIVDTTRGDKLKINVDIVFHKIGCSYVTIDTMDSSGESQVNVQRNIFKRRLDLEGRPLQDPEKDEGGAIKANITDVATVKCGSCYGAESAAHKCCGTCTDVRNAYTAKGWAMPDPSGVEQCQNIQLAEHDLKALQEGCQVYGYLEVSRVGGNFHMSPGRSYQLGHMHIHDMQPFTASEFDMSHTIRHLSFGHNVPGKTNPIDGTKSTASAGGSMYKYFVKIVPTMWQNNDGFTLSSNQFSMTRYSQVPDEMSGSSSAPGLFFMYEFAPVMVKYSEKQKSWLHLITTLCSIIGGVVTVASLLDSAIFHSARAIQKKVDLGKQG